MYPQSLQHILTRRSRSCFAAAAVGMTIALAALVTPLRTADAQAVPVFESAGFAAHRDWNGMKEPREIAVRPADAFGRAEIVALSGLAIPVPRAERWRITPEGMPEFAGFLALRGVPTAVAWTDVDGDGHADLVFGENGPAFYGLEIFTSTPSGLDLNARAVDGTNRFSGETRAILATDVNGDGRPDLCLGRYDASYQAEISARILLASADSFVVASYSSAPVSGLDFTPADLDGDSHVDLIGFSKGDHCLYFSNGVGDGTFTFDWVRRENPPPADGPPLVADLNGDGTPDLVAGRYVYFGVPGGEPALSDSLERAAQDLADVDHDGRADLIAYGSGEVLVAHGRGDGRFAPFEPAGSIGALETSSPWLPVLATAADLDGDGWTDVVGTDVLGSTMQFARGRPGGTLWRPLELPTGAHPVEVRLADVVGGDGRPDLVALARGNRRLEVRRGLGDGGFGPAASYDLPAGARRFELGDLDEDGHLDVAVACDSARTLAILWGDGNGFTGRTDLAADDSLLEPALGDLDGDGHLDVMASTPSRAPRAWTGGGTRLPIDLPVSVDRGVVGRFELRDFDGDGNLDVVSPDPDPSWDIGLGSGYRVGFGDGLGHFGGIDLGGSYPIAVTIPGGGFTTELDSPFTFAFLPGFDRAFFVCVSEFDSSGARYSWLNGADYSVDARSWSVRLGGDPHFAGQLGTPPVHELPPTPVQVELSDVTNDGLPDVVALFREPALLAVLPGLPGAAFADPILHTVGLEPSSFALGDVDGDGLTDVVVADEGGDDVLVLRHRPMTLAAPPAVPAAGGLSLRVRSALSAPVPRFDVALAGYEPAVLELFDPQGRRLSSQRIASPSPGLRTITLEAADLPAAGLLFARLRQGRAEATCRLVMLR